MAQKERGAEDFNPKHRILGAIILVAAAVIVVPLLLKQHEPPAELDDRKAIDSPDRGETPNKVVVTPITPSVTPNRSGTEAPAPATEPAPANSASKDSASKKEPLVVSPEARATKPAAAKSVEKEKTTSKSAPTKQLDKGWVVQVGTFASSDNANRLSAKLKQQGHTVLSETISLDGRSAVRLRVGPFGDKAAALKTQARIERDQGIKGVVLTYP